LATVDSHSHLADPRLSSDVAEFLIEAKKLGISTHVQAGIGPEDWQRQQALKQKFPEFGIVPVFGLHPYWVSEHTREECEQALDSLARELLLCPALGETGLDFRESILLKGQTSEATANTDLIALLLMKQKEQQIDFFQAQIEMALLMDKPVVLHLVKSHQETQTILNFNPGLRGFVHSFNGSLKEAQFYIKQGFLISVGGPLARNTNIRLQEVVKQLPLEFLMLETDSPDQAPDSLRGQLNRPASLIEVAKVVAELHGKTISEVLDRCSDNCRKLLRL
jgi:TatD DNase family protein